tara:strand:+ start:1567 stop:1881 length:315 start_codon:yes stop_codon:yes gene_type:complete
MSDQNNKKKKNNEWANRELGALWKKESSTQKYLSGHVKIDDGMGGEDTLQVIIFANKHKEKDNHPDFRIYKSQPLAKKTTSGQTPVVSEVESNEVQEVPEEDVL